MTDEQLTNWLRQVTVPGPGAETEIDYATRKLNSLHRARFNEPISHRRLAYLLRKTFGSERRGRFEVIPRGVSI